MPQQTTEQTTRRVEVFRPGTFRAMNGQEYTFSSEDVAAMATGYDPESSPAPVVVGHPKHDDPAFGWARGFEVGEDGTLIAELGDLAPEFISAVEDGRYRKVSMKFFPPEASNNPAPGTYYPRHIGFLGGAAPAVSGLAPVQFADGEEAELVEIEFGAQEVGESAASVLRSLREFVIEKFGREDADKAVPEYQIRWIEGAGKEPEETPDFAEPPQETPKKETPMPDMQSLAEREARVAARERNLAHTENTAFAEALIEQGRLVPAQRAGVIALLDELATGGDREIAFSENGEEKKTSAEQLLKDVLSAAPEGVAFGAQDLGDDPEKKEDITFASDGLAVDPEGLAAHQRALDYQAKNPGTAYLDAVHATKEG